MCTAVYLNTGRTVQDPTICLDTVGEGGVRSSDLTGHSRIKRCTVHHSSWTQPSWAMEGPAVSVLDPYSKMDRRRLRSGNKQVKRTTNVSCQETAAQTLNPHRGPLLYAGRCMHTGGEARRGAASRAGASTWKWQLVDCSN